MYKSYLDKISIFVASLCIVHCIALPLFLTTLPFWGFEILENKHVEVATILISSLVGGFTIFNGYKNYHRSIAVAFLFLVGLVLMIAANLINGEVFEMCMKGAGALMVIRSHVVNWRKSRACTVCKG